MRRRFIQISKSDIVNLSVRPKNVSAKAQPVGSHTAAPYFEH